MTSFQCYFPFSWQKPEQQENHASCITTIYGDIQGKIRSNKNGKDHVCFTDTGYFWLFGLTLISVRALTFEVQQSSTHHKFHHIFTDSTQGVKTLHNWPERMRSRWTCSKVRCHLAEKKMTALLSHVRSQLGELRCPHLIRENKIPINTFRGREET